MASDWLDGIKAQQRRLGPRGVVAEISQRVIDFPDFDELTAEETEQLSKALEVIQGITRAHGSTEQSHIIELMLLSKLGRFEEATGRAKEAFERSRDWSTAIALANAARRAGDPASAIEYFAAAAELDPKDVTALLDLGDLHLEADRWADALSAYEASLSRQKDQAWALPSAYFCRYVLTRRSKWLRKLRVIANRPLDECGLEGVLAKLIGSYSSEQGRSRAEYLLSKLT